MTDVIVVASRAEMANLGAPTAGQVVFLSEAFRQGNFQCFSGTIPSGDALQGLYVVSNTGGYYWARVWDGVTGYPEWFGALVNSNVGSIPSDNLAALQACINFCSKVQLSDGVYYTSGTWWINQPHRFVTGVTTAIEDLVGSRICCVDIAQDVIRVGGVSGSLLNLTSVHRICASWDGNLVPPTAGNEINAPKAFNIQYNLDGDFERLFAYNAIIGHYFYGNVNTTSRKYGCTRTAVYGGSNDIMRGVWVRGTPTIYAGGNASLYLFDGNVTLGGAYASAAAVVNAPAAMGLFADGDFADTYIDGLETSQVPYPLQLDGTGGTYAGGHGDVHIRRLVFDQGNGNGGIKITNLHTLAKIHFDGGYMQFNDNSAGNRGVWLEGGAGVITFDNFQFLGGGTTSLGIYARNQPNLTLSDSCIVEGMAYPVTLDVGCLRASVKCLIGDGTNSSGGTRAAMTVVAANQAILQPKIAGAAGSFSEGINLAGTDHVSATIDPTAVDGGAIANGRKVAINANKIGSPGYYNSSGFSGVSGNGLFVTGVTG